jgi:HSP20 family protein
MSLQMRRPLDFFFNNMFDTFHDEWSQHVYSTDTGYVIEVPVPGMTKKDVKIQIKDNMIHITAQKTDAKNTSKMTRQYQYTHSIPKDAKLGSMKTHVEHGLLTIHMSKKKVTTK